MPNLLRRIWWEFRDKPEDKTCRVQCVRWGAPVGGDECRRDFYGEFMLLAKLRREIHRIITGHA